MAAQNGTLTLRSLKTGRTFTVDCYLPDAVSTFVGFAPTGLASSTSPTQYRVPSDCIIEDFAATAAPTAVGNVLTVNSALINGGTMRYAAQLVSLNSRTKFNIRLAKGDIIQYVQF